VRAAVVAKADQGALLRIVNGEDVGTLFVADGEPIGDAEIEEQHIDPLYSGIAPQERNPMSKL